MSEFWWREAAEWCPRQSDGRVELQMERRAEAPKSGAPIFYLLVA